MGIIPARAGFTEAPFTDGDDVEDHPRSRGVYAVKNVASGDAGWIIPARAGFTSSAPPGI